MSGCLRCDSPYHQDCYTPVTRLPKWERLREHDRRVAVARTSRPEAVLAAFHLLAGHAEREPWSGLHAQTPGLSVRTDAVVTDAVRILRGRA